MYYVYYRFDDSYGNCNFRMNYKVQPRYRAGAVVSSTLKEKLYPARDNDYKFIYPWLIPSQIHTIFLTAGPFIAGSTTVSWLERLGRSFCLGYHI